MNKKKVNRNKGGRFKASAFVDIRKQAVRWAALEEILEMIDDGRFIPYEKGLIELLFFQRNHRGAHTRKDTTGA